MLLAPMARDRKGEFAEGFAQWQAQGFVRFRVDGKIVEASDLRPLDKREKHDVDVVVDRLKVRPDMAQRLAESLETCLRLSGGRALALDMDQSVEHGFNATFACPHCLFAMGELEPRLFSFNSPLGACPACEGLGEQSFFDPARIVAFPELSLASGAIKGWDKRNPYYFALLESLARHYHFEVETPFEALPASVREVILYGSGEEKIKFTEVGASGSQTPRKTTRARPFEGIVHNMARRYRDTESALVREELARYRGLKACEACEGTRLRTEARHVKLGSGSAALTLHAVNQLTLADCLAHFKQLMLTGNKAEIAHKVVQEIIGRLTFLNDVGLTYLSLSRSADTLSGGEAQRIRLASQIGSGLTGVMYVLDEPSIGLHQRDNDRLIETLKHLRDIGNSVLVVEHDEDMIRAADHCIDMGPGAGIHGGRVMAQGTPQALMAHPDSLTGRYMRGALQIAVPEQRRKGSCKVGAVTQPVSQNVFGQPVAPSAETTSQLALTVVGARAHNLQNVTVSFPLGLFTCVTGVSGSGKSTLVNDTLYAALAHQVHRAHLTPAAHDDILGMEHIDKVINVDQSPIGRTPRSNPATYTGLFAPLRELMAEVPMARERGYGPGRFSFNVEGGRCSACQGDGMVKVEMHFLPDVYVPCDVCEGKRYNRETLEVRYKGQNIADILDMTVEDALAFFQSVPALARKLTTLMEVGLGYIRLGQAATTLSGGEAQRVKLALELSKRDTGRTLYILDEPTTGLHFADIDLLLKVLQQLVDAGNTVVVIEHNLDVIKTADWVIDMGPQGGRGGGQVVAQGTPEDLAANPQSITGQYLQRYLP
jgi:excinuclease ABC subunit A